MFKGPDDVGEDAPDFELVNPMTPVAITGLGFFGAAGLNVEELRARFQVGRTAITQLEKAKRPEASIAFGALVERTEFGSIALKRALSQHPDPSLIDRVLNSMDSSIQFSVTAAVEALAKSTFLPERLGLVVGGSNLGHPTLFKEFQRYQDNPARVNPRLAFEALDTHLAAVLATVVNAKGPVISVAAAAASGLYAAITAMDLIRLGRCDACVVVGALQQLTPPEWRALSALGAVNLSDEASAPMCVGSSGFSPGEAAACLLFEGMSSAHRRRAHIYAEVRGGAYLSAADPMPHASSDDETRSMTLALESSRLSVNDIDLVTMHATGTLQGDDAELIAIKNVFGPRVSELWAFTPKAITGHCLTSSGVVGLIASTLMLEDQMVYPIPTGRIPKFTTPHFAQSAISQPIRHTMTNAFGFGGFNSSLILSLP